MTRNFDWEYYREVIEPKISTLTKKQQVELSFACVCRISKYVSEFEENTIVVNLSLNLIKKWLSGLANITQKEIDSVQEKLLAIESHASDMYEETDHTHAVISASPDGIKAARAAYAASALNAAIYNIYRTDFFGETVAPSVWCCEAVALSWAATLGEPIEKEWQLRKLEELMSN